MYPSVFKIKNENPITLELACGGGEYTIAMAKLFPDRNFIGVDVKGARIWKGARRALDEPLDNVAFLRTRIEQIYLFVDENEVDPKAVTFQNLNGNIHDFKIQGPNISGDIDGLQFVENHGIEVISLTSDFTFTKQEMKLLNTSLKTETSSVFMDLVFHRNGSFSDFNNKVKFDAEIW